MGRSDNVMHGTRNVTTTTLNTMTNAAKDCRDVVLDCAATSPDFSWWRRSMNPCVEAPWSVPRLKFLLSHGPHPEGLVSLHLQPYHTICRNCVRIFKLHGMDSRHCNLTLPSGCSYSFDDECKCCTASANLLAETSAPLCY